MPETNLETIRERWVGDDWPGALGQAKKDIAALLAELDKSQAALRRVLQCAGETGADHYDDDVVNAREIRYVVNGALLAPVAPDAEPGGAK